MSAQELKAAIINAWPPGTEGAIDWGQAPGKHIEAVANALDAQAVAPAEQFAADVNPLTCSAARLAEWEGVLMLADSTTARSGTLQARRNAVISRFREWGQPTVPVIQATVGPLLDYADPLQLVVLTTDRAALTAAHTYSSDLITGSRNFSYGSPATVRWFVRDDGVISTAGAWVDITISASSVASLSLALYSPDGSFLTVAPKWRGSASTTTFRVYFRAFGIDALFYARAVFGAWSLQIVTTNVSDSGSISGASLFVEGMGRDARGNNGGAAPAFEFACLYEASKSRGAPDFDAARAAIKRLTFATRTSGLCFRSTGNTLADGDYAPLPDDANAIPDAMIPG